MGLVKDEDVLKAAAQPDEVADEPMLELGWDAIVLDSV
jgi:hypothetical protein